MRRTLKTTATATAVLALAGGLSVAPSIAFGYGDSSYSGGSYSGDSRTYGDTLKVTGLRSGGRAIVDLTTSDSTPRDSRAVRGLATGEFLVGIDYRPASGFDNGTTDNGDLYGLSSASKVYKIARDGQATLLSTLTTPLNGSTFDIDFNPTVDRLRVVSDTGQNLRINVDTGATLVDGALTYPNAGNDPVRQANATGITGAAYTNNDNDFVGTTAPPAGVLPTGTTLYDLDTTLDQVSLQTPPNSGFLSATGKFGTPVSGDTGFDIYSKIRNGIAVELFPYAVAGGSLYDVTLFNGRLDNAGSVGDVVDLAIPLNQL